MYGYIYITTNTVNGKQYIGKHKSNVFDIKYYGSGVALNRAIDKYGIKNFNCKVLCECLDEIELNLKEKEYIQEYDAVNSKQFYNVADGGHGGNTLSGKSDEEMLAFGQITKDRWDRLTAEEKKILTQKISSALKDVSKSDLHKQHLSESFKNNKSHAQSKNGMYNTHRTKESNPVYGWHFYNNGSTEVFVDEHTYLLQYKDKEYVKGRLQSKLNALHKDASKRALGNTNCSGTVRIHKEGLEKSIKPELLYEYLNKGWLKGRKSKNILQ